MYVRVQSFENIHKWLKEIETHSGGSVLKLLVGMRPSPASSFFGASCFLPPPRSRGVHCRIVPDVNTMCARHAHGHTHHRQQVRFGVPAGHPNGEGPGARQFVTDALRRDLRRTLSSAPSLLFFFRCAPRSPSAWSSRRPRMFVRLVRQKSVIRVDEAFLTLIKNIRDQVQ